MKIGQPPELPSAVAQANAAKQAKTAASAAEAGAKVPAPAASAAAGVPVTLSRTAREIEQTGRNQGDFDAGRVKAVRSAIESGTFKVDAGAIADKMLANAEEIISRSRG
ncbi:MAG: flagellar biosynthesis anti-sigma factor FlgM [Burkholderiaceae bacterium]|nr:flagellar biosynthesis anti-sigma factor FlgM [Burkholderiaceae bacterium]MCO5103491.1 flagellar biosynthesis anti-sigma factor FlgM [Burkholderiaceae bacterium]